MMVSSSRISVCRMLASESAEERSASAGGGGGAAAAGAAAAGAASCCCEATIATVRAPRGCRWCCQARGRPAGRPAGAACCCCALGVLLLLELLHSARAAAAAMLVAGRVPWLRDERVSAQSGPAALAEL